jgi:peptidoglycan/LPS O-acetylase OafA/YrhL
MENSQRFDHRHLPQLDGLRGIAVLIVIFGHLAMYDFGLGVERLAPIAPTGVDLFFVLSGFLITGILWRTRQTERYYLNFYARRALRIWPLYGLFLLFMFVWANRWIPVLALPPGTHWQVFALFIQNLWYQQPDQMGMVLVVTWSLAVEEQFYLVWPLGISRLSRRVAAAVLAAAIVGAPIARWLMAPHDYMNPICRCDALAMGALLALWLATCKPQRREIKNRALIVIAFGLCGEVIGLVTGARHVLQVTMVSAIFTGLLALALVSNGLTRILSTPVLRFTGKVSYCLYLSHTIVCLLVLHLISGMGWTSRVIRIVIILAASYGVATLSWHLIENPALKLKRHFESRNAVAPEKPMREVFESPAG